MRLLPAETWGVPGLVQAYWWAEPGSGVGGCGTGVPEFSVDLLVGGPSS